MSERESKAEAAARRLRERSLSPDESVRQGLGPVPHLRLRSDAPSVATEDISALDEALRRLPDEESGAVVLRANDGEPKGIILSAERYFELAGMLLRQHLQEYEPGIGWTPTEEAFAATLTEQADPTEQWPGLVPIGPQ